MREDRGAEGPEWSGMWGAGGVPLPTEAEVWGGDNAIFFYFGDVISRNLSKSASFERGGSL